MTKANDLEIRNQFHTNVKNTYSRNNWSSANSSLVASTVRSQNDPSIYETAANSIDTSIIRNKLKSTASSVIYSGTNFNSVKDNHIISEHYSDPTRPLLSAQNSILTLKPTIWRTCDNGSSMMQVIYVIKDIKAFLLFINIFGNYRNLSFSLVLNLLLILTNMRPLHGTTNW